MLNENRLYSISLGVASLQDGLVGVATALSPAMAGHFKFLLHHFFVRLGLTQPTMPRPFARPPRFALSGHAVRLTTPRGEPELWRLARWRAALKDWRRRRV